MIKTPWLTLYDGSFGRTAKSPTDIKYIQQWVCDSILKKYFKIPKTVTRIRFFAHKKPTRHSIPVVVQCGFSVRMPDCTQALYWTLWDRVPPTWRNRTIHVEVEVEYT